MGNPVILRATDQHGLAPVADKVGAMGSAHLLPTRSCG